jgi:hypothetical protein
MMGFKNLSAKYFPFSNWKNCSGKVVPFVVTVQEEKWAANPKEMGFIFFNTEVVDINGEGVWLKLQIIGYVSVRTNSNIVGKERIENSLGSKVANLRDTR